MMVWYQLKWLIVWYQLKWLVVWYQLKIVSKNRKVRFL